MKDCVKECERVCLLDTCIRVDIDPDLPVILVPVLYDVLLHPDWQVKHSHQLHQSTLKLPSANKKCMYYVKKI